MVVAALRGGLGFLTRLPVGHDEPAWDAFRRTPAAFPVVGYVAGAAIAVPLLLPAAPVAAAAFVAGVYLATGINNVDGLGDLGDAAAVHGDRAARVAAMKDADLGVGGTLAVAGVVATLALAGLALAALPAAALGIVVASEVGAKLGLAAIACLGTARHDGLGARLTAANRPRDLVVPVVLAAPALALTWPRAAAAAALLASVVAALVVRSWARARLGGVSGDVFGAANELARVAGLHVGVLIWTLGG